MTPIRIAEIHKNLVNGQRRQMAEQIQEYGLYNFWDNYKNYLHELYEDLDPEYDYFSDAVISYHRIINR